MIAPYGSRDNTTLQNLLPLKSSTNPVQLFACVRKLNCGFSILQCLQANPRALMTPEGISDHLKRPVEVIDNDLSSLQELGLVSPKPIAGIVFFGLDPDPAKRKLVRELLARRDFWYA